MFKELFEYMPMEKWAELQEAFKRDWPRGVSAFWALQTQKVWVERGLLHDFKVYCPVGDVMYGMIAINNKDSFKEIIIQCPSDDTKKLEEALRTTKIIDWNDNITIPFPQNHITQGIGNVLSCINMYLELDKNLVYKNFNSSHCLKMFAFLKLSSDIYQMITFL
nr:uncharacterized protein LOC128677629 [Plodia interpunctella]